MQTHPKPELVWLEHLVKNLRTGRCEPGSWAAGGRALAVGLLDDRGPDGALPVWASDLADTLVGSLLGVLATGLDDRRASERVPLALSAAVLRVARPHAARVIDGAIDACLGWTSERPSTRHPASLLAPWAQLNLLRGDVDGASACAYALLEADPEGVGLILHDWVVARIQHHGPNRELQCFHSLRAALCASPTPRPAWLVTAAATAAGVAGCSDGEVLSWLDAESEVRGTPLRTLDLRAVAS